MLRGINVGRTKKIKMDELRDLYESLNFKNVTSYIQSGNVVFKFEDVSPPKLSAEIEKKIKEVFSFDVKVFIRTKDEFHHTIANNPFKREDPKYLHVTFLSDSPKENPIQEIDLLRETSEKFSITVKKIYLFLPKGYARTKLSNGFFEKKLRVSATTRNWRTVNKLYDIANDADN